MNKLNSYLTILVINLVSINALIYTSCINNNHITLTFDDGPSEYTQKIGSILNKNKISGTFFMNGMRLNNNKNYKNIISNLNKNNHIIGTHTYSHLSLTKYSNFIVRKDLYYNEMSIFNNILNNRPYYFRAPYFDYDTRIDSIITEFGYNIISASFETTDWFTPEDSNRVFETIKKNLDNISGKIILLHEYNSNVQILQKIIDYALLKNYTFVPLNLCLNSNINYQNLL